MKDKHVPPKLTRLESHNAFVARHVGPDESEIATMLSRMGADNLDQLINDIVPANIRLRQPLALAEPVDEHAALARLQRMAEHNRPCKSLIGLGYYGTHTPPVILRNVFENPGWYTAYTPYQAEIAQGRLEALLNFQQMVIDLTGLEIANASLLDEATAAAEAMAMARRLNKTDSNAFFVDQACYPQTLDVLANRAKHFGFELVLGPAEQADEHDVFGALFQNPDERGRVRDLGPIVAAARRRGTITAVATDPMALILIRPPGELGADITFGSAQRFGVPMGFGGPHAAFFATRREYLRAMPGRIIGVSRDKRNHPALRMALQTREQHIRREKATSNICTSQVLLANMAGFYAVYHGAQGLRVIAERIHHMAAILAEGLRRAGIRPTEAPFFDTLCVHSAAHTQQWLKAAESRQINLRRIDASHIGISIDETVTREELESLLNIFGVKDSVDELDQAVCEAPPILPPALQRDTPVLEHPVFHEHRTEHRMLRYLRTLQNRDLAMDHSMIPLGSCTMKLNASSEMLPITWPAFAHVHPFTPVEQTKGYLELIESLSGYLKAVTGFPALSLQPNSGALGEYAGLVAIARYHAARGEAHRDVCLVPRSAHGTNPASAQMCGMRVVEIECDAEGNVDREDLRDKCAQHHSNLAALMLTYPSTHGVFEPAVRELCDCVHAHGGQVYMDGANLNAQIGLTSPAALGADVAHINLHKTFCIPHGGGGPGMGPIGVATHLAPFLPDHTLIPTGNAQRPNKGQGAVAAAPYGSASILPISWMYITMMGGEGLKHATRIALLNANYLASRLAPHYTVLFTGEHGRVAHECIIDIRPIRQTSAISEVDIAKRLMDYGFHAPTMSFPVAGTMMIEPTESEGLDELDRFIEAMIRIRQEIQSVEQGAWPVDDNPLVNAPHTQADLVDDWTHPYSRETAVFPLAWLREHKFWPSVNRIDEVYGDRHLFCGCVPPVDYER